MTTKGISEDELCINTIRFLSAEGVEKANSGHPGTPMALAPLAYTLWTKHLKHNPSNPKWPDRDRFVLSCGHASMLIYSMLHLTGYNLSLEDLKNFRQWNSKTPGHPEYKHTEGIETTTGPLGQGIANAVGFAMAETMLAKKFNKPGFELVNHNTYAVVSDGDLMEGISHESASIAGHLKLGKLIVFYDDNTITIDGHTDLAFSENIKMRFESYGWHVQTVDDGDSDIEAISRSTDQAKKQKDKPSLIIVKTTIAFGSPNKQNTSGAHGSPLGEDEIKLAKKKLGWPYDKSFFVPEEAKKVFNKCSENGKNSEKEWNSLFNKYKQKFSSLAKEWDLYNSGKLPSGWEKSLPSFDPGEKAIATRKASGKVLNAIAGKIPNLVGGSADLHPSTNTYLDDFKSYSTKDRDGRNFHYGIREHAMGAIQNGLTLHGQFIPLCSTFLVFSDYMRPPIRLAALMGIRSIFVYTHDSIGVGEDGPTHQPIEQIAALRAIPNNVVLRPADANETRAAWKVALERNDGPSCIILTRQSLPTLHGAVKNIDAKVFKGAYILEETDPNPDIILIATGSEVQWAVEAKKVLEKEVSARVVSMPSWELFEKQDTKYKEKILPSKVKARLSIEAGISQGWHKYIGSEGKVISIEKFGASAPGDIVMEKYGFSTKNVVKQAELLLKH
jgi:transketolase